MPDHDHHVCVQCGRPADDRGAGDGASDVRDELNARRGRRAERRWLFVEPQPDGRWLLETCWLPVAVPGFTRHPHSGRWQARVQPDAEVLRRSFEAVTEAFLVANRVDCGGGCR